MYIVRSITIILLTPTSKPIRLCFESKGYLVSALLEFSIPFKPVNNWIF